MLKLHRELFLRETDNLEVLTPAELGIASDSPAAVLFQPVDTHAERRPALLQPEKEEPMFLTGIGGALVEQLVPRVLPVLGIGGGGSTCPDQASTAEVQHMLAVLSADELAWLKDMARRNGFTWKDDPEQLARSAAGGSDCRVANSRDRAWLEAFQTMLARSRTRAAPGTLVSGPALPPTAQPTLQAPTGTTQPGVTPGTYAGGAGTYEPLPSSSTGAPSSNLLGRSPWLNIGFGFGIPPWVWLVAIALGAYAFTHRTD